MGTAGDKVIYHVNKAGSYHAEVPTSNKNLSAAGQIRPLMMVEAACETEQHLHSVYDCNTDEGAMQAHTTDNDGSVSPKILRPIKGEN